MTLLDILRQRFPAAKMQTLRRMLENGRVTVNGRPARKLKAELAEGDEVRVSDEGPKKPEPARKRSPVPIVYEDADVIVIDKPAGLLTSTTPREKRPTVLRFLSEELARRDPDAHVGVVHRLDREAAGLLVFSKNEDAYRSLKEQFFDHSVERVYTAIVEGLPNPRQGRIATDLYELPDGRVVTSRMRGKGQPAVTEYETLKKLPGPGKSFRGLLRVTLQTGRKHQIRTHLSQRSVPIVGDPIYGANPEPAEPLMLCATHLAFTHPATGKRLVFDIPPTAPMQALIGS